MNNLNTIKKLTAASAMAGFLGLAALSVGSGFAHAEPASDAQSSAASPASGASSTSSSDTNSATDSTPSSTNSTTDSASAGTNSATGSPSTSDGSGTANATTAPTGESTTSTSSPSSKVGSEPTSSVSSSGGSISQRWQDNATAQERREMRQLEDMYKQSLPGVREIVLEEYKKRLNDLQNRTSPPAP